MKRIPSLLVFVAFFFTLLSSRAADARQDFLKLIARPRVALDAKVQELPATNGVTQINFSFLSETNQRVPGLLVI